MFIIAIAHHQRPIQLFQFELIVRLVESHILVLMRIVMLGIALV